MPTAALQPSQMLLIFGAGLVLVIIVFWLMMVLISSISPQESPVKSRLKALKYLQRGEQGIRDIGVLNDVKEVLIQFSEPISKHLYGENAKFQKQIKQSLTEAGMIDTDAAVWRCLSIQVATGLALGAGGFCLSLLVVHNFAMNLAVLIVGLLVGRMLPMFSLRARAGKRKAEIRFNMPDALDLMVVCVEAGLGLDATIQRVSEDMDTIAPDLAHEFKRLNRELNAGISRMEAFQNLGVRGGVDELKSLCALIIQSDKLGTSIADTLRIYADDMRVRRRQKAEELASKASIKITFPLVLLIFPPLFIVLIGPTVLQALKTFSH